MLILKQVLYIIIIIKKKKVYSSKAKAIAKNF